MTGYSFPPIVTVTSAFGSSTVPVKVVVLSASGTIGSIVTYGAFGGSATGASS